MLPDAQFQELFKKGAIISQDTVYGLYQGVPHTACMHFTEMHTETVTIKKTPQHSIVDSSHANQVPRIDCFTTYSKGIQQTHTVRDTCH